MNVSTKTRIIFSSTRGWNPGDEFILMGIRNLLRLADVDYMEILYNRHPAIRTVFPLTDKVLKGASFIFAQNPDMQMKQYGAGKTIPHFDNSFFPIKHRIADYVIFAGTPEWAGKRNRQLYRYALENEIPGALLGIGLANSIAESERQYISKYAELITTRDDEAYQQLKDFGAIRSVCPALFCAQYTNPISDINRIGIVFQGTRIWANSIPQTMLATLVPIYRELIHNGAMLICHHFADMTEAIDIFGEDAPILYSSNPEQLLQLYSHFDLIIGTRLHGIGAAASYGIPGILIPHDNRTKGSDSFCEVIAPPEKVLNTIEKMDWINKSKKIVNHRKHWQSKMLNLIGNTSIIRTK